MTSAIPKSSHMPATNAGGLVEQAGPIIKQLADVVENGFEGDCERLHSRFEEHFAAFERRSLRSGISDGEVQSAKYALVALVDETVLLSELPLKDEWLGRPLQMQYFDEFAAGEEFYNKLEALRLVRSPQGADVLEVYHLCMTLGFKGKFGDARGVERRKVLMESLAHDIAQNRGVAPDAGLAPNGLPGDRAALAGTGGSFLARSPLWVIPAIVATVLLIAVIITGVLSDRQLAAFPAGERVGAQP